MNKIEKFLNQISFQLFGIYSENDENISLVIAPKSKSTKNTIMMLVKYVQFLFTVFTSLFCPLKTICFDVSVVL